MTMICALINGGTPYDVGMIPGMLNEDDPRPAREQLDAGYQHGGGWQPFEGFTLSPRTHALKYTGDPALHPVAVMRLRDEAIMVYPYGWVVILQPDGTFEACRMD